MILGIHKAVNGDCQNESIKYYRQESTEKCLVLITFLIEVQTYFLAEYILISYKFFYFFHFDFLLISKFFIYK